MDSSCVKKRKSNSQLLSEIPSEVLEYILSLLSPYTDLLTCKLVCKYWFHSVHSTLRRKAREFRSSLISSSIEWNHFYPAKGSFFSSRYSHSCCRFSNLIYIFGGCSKENTTFNDLWTFDLSNRQWIRPLIGGNYPPPKACSSFVSYQNKLILFGGWTYKSQDSIHEASWKLFNHIHEFDTRLKKWSLLETKNQCPPMSGHTASIFNHEMIIFGGLQFKDYSTYFNSTNDVWIFNFQNLTWRNQVTTNPKPPPRYGHSQLSLDNSILILGGCEGPANLLNDIWLLQLTEPIWTWSHIQIFSDSPLDMPLIGFHPACKVDDLVVVLNKRPPKNFLSLMEQLLINKNSQKNDIDSSIKYKYRLKPQPSPSEKKKRMNLDQPIEKPSVRPNARFDRAKQLNNLDKMEQKLKNNESFTPIVLSTQQITFPLNLTEPLSVFVLDISAIQTKKICKWFPQNNLVCGPQELSLYSLTVGFSEIIMFGGVHKDTSSEFHDHISNSVHILRAQRKVI